MSNSMEMPSLPSLVKKIESEEKIDDDKLFGKRLLKQRGTKQSNEIASEVGVSPSSVSAWENGRTFPDVGSESAAALAYGIELKEFLELLEFSRKAHQMKMDTLKEALRDQNPKLDKI